MHGLPVPEWAGDAQRVVAVAAGVEDTPFQPKENVRIETGGWVGGWVGLSDWFVLYWI